NGVGSPSCRRKLRRDRTGARGLSVHRRRRTFVLSVPGRLQRSAGRTTRLLCSPARGVAHPGDRGGGWLVLRIGARRRLFARGAGALDPQADAARGSRSARGSDAELVYGPGAVAVSGTARIDPATVRPSRTGRCATPGQAGAGG